jgi:transposase InsO family protein
VRCSPCRELLPEGKKATTIGFPARAVGCFSEQGITCHRILRDNGSAYRSREWRKACSLDLKPIRISPYTPRTNGKAERFIRSLLKEWADGMVFRTSDECNQCLPRYLGIHNGCRCHTPLAGPTPRPSLQRLRIAE